MQHTHLPVSACVSTGSVCPPAPCSGRTHGDTLCGWPHARSPPRTYGHAQSISAGAGLHAHKTLLVAPWGALSCTGRRTACACKPRHRWQLLPTHRCWSLSPSMCCVQCAVYPHGTQAAVDTPSSQGRGRMRVLGGRFALKAFVLPGLVGKTQLYSPGRGTPQSLSYPVQHCLPFSGSTLATWSLPIFAAVTYTGWSWHLFSVSFTI